jgi:RNA polymerase sigma-70 factor (ECF subfamily)
VDSAGRYPVVYCVIPQELASKLHDELREFWRDDPHVRVVVERREEERRLKGRRSKGKVTRADERREVGGTHGRRVADRRSVIVSTSPRALPRRARRYADQLVFFERFEPAERSLRDEETQRLILRYQGGDPSVVGDIYEGYFDEVYAYTRVALGGHHQAEDATQMVFEKALGALKRYEVRPGKPFRAWLFRIARNVVVDTGADQRRLLLEDPAELDRYRESFIEEAANTTLSWMTDGEVSMFVERLPETQRQLLVLRFLLDMSTEEIAVVLGRSAGAVRKLQSRALHLLEGQLAATGHRASRVRRTSTLIRLRAPRVLVERRFALLGSGSPPGSTFGGLRRLR